MDRRARTCPSAALFSARSRGALARVPRWVPMFSAHLNRGFSYVRSELNDQTTDADRWLALRAVIEYRAPKYRANSWNRGDSALNEQPIDASRTLHSAHARLLAGVGTDARSYADALRLWSTFASNASVLPSLVGAMRDIAAQGDASDSPATFIGPFVLRSARALLAWRRQQTVEPGSYDRSNSMLRDGRRAARAQRGRRDRGPR